MKQVVVMRPVWCTIVSVAADACAGDSFSHALIAPITAAF
jgi:hypothetical protein